MLTALRVEGLRSFAQPVEIRLAPITLLYGRNSSGKTTLLSALSLLRQTAEHGAEGMARLRSDGPLVDLGAFRNLVAGHDSGRTVWLGLDIEEVGVTWSLDLAYREPGELIRVRISWEGGDVGAQLDLERREQAGQASYAPLHPDQWPPEPLVSWLAHILGDPLGVDGAWADERAGAEGPSPVQDLLETDESVRTSLALWLEEIEQLDKVTHARGAEEQEADQGEDALPVGLFGASDPLGLPARATRVPALFNDEPVHERVWLALDSVLSRLETAFVAALASVRHVGPVRTPPERTIVLSEARSADEVGPDGGLQAAVGRRKPAFGQCVARTDGRWLHRRANRARRIHRS